MRDCLRRVTCGLVACVVAIVACAIAMEARQAPAAPPPAGNANAPAPQPAPWTDPLGRSTPRGSARAFLDAARSGDNARAALYLDTRRPEKADLATKLFAVLDARLPARLVKISDERDGSDPARPDREVVGTIEGDSGPADVVLVRVQRATEPGPIWLISSQTVDAAARQYDEIANSRW